ncbi:predicted protein [Methanosarcina acetivorans C2A]|uniref:Uncharacterized protein n=1 Tax=Methanosarcina acetivorans (strain ATCC 35395 / DSM 2834 / JCM 12185 / C2A) TaxID=188937 RepID=Q8THU9_METAC|nr:predicted protein [Methanosarcina acetivorans C2A]
MSGGPAKKKKKKFKKEIRPEFLPLLSIWFSFLLTSVSSSFHFRFLSLYSFGSLYSLLGEDRSPSSSGARVTR